MARIAYDSVNAAAYEATRHLTEEGLVAWREAITRHIDPRPGMRLLDLGSGTGSWARTFTTWYLGLTRFDGHPRSGAGGLREDVQHHGEHG